MSIVDIRFLRRKLTLRRGSIVRKLDRVLTEARWLSKFPKMTLNGEKKWF